MGPVEAHKCMFWPSTSLTPGTLGPLTLLKPKNESRCATTLFAYQLFSTCAPKRLADKQFTYSTTVMTAESYTALYPHDIV